MTPKEKAEFERTKRRIYWRRVGMVTWVSFVAACVASMVFFAMFDPDELAKITTFPIKFSSTAGYSFGFLLFWLLTAATGSALNFMLSLPAAKLRKPVPHVDDSDK